MLILLLEVQNENPRRSLLLRNFTENQSYLSVPLEVYLCDHFYTVIDNS